MGAGEGLFWGVGEGADTLMMPFAVGPVEARRQLQNNLQ